MTVVGLDKVVLWKLEVDLEVFLGSDGPDAIDGRVVGAAVLQSVGADVGRADEILQTKGNDVTKLRIFQKTNLILIQVCHYSTFLSLCCPSSK